MKKTKILSLLTAATMLFACIPYSAGAQKLTGLTYEVSEDFYGYAIGGQNGTWTETGTDGLSIAEDEKNAECIKISAAKKRACSDNCHSYYKKWGCLLQDLPFFYNFKFYSHIFLP